MADVRRRGGTQQDALAGMEGRLAALEEPDLAMEQRLQAIEQVLTAIREELAEPDPHSGVADALRQVSLRLDMAEQNHSEMLAELRAGLARIPEPVEEEPVAFAELISAPGALDLDLMAEAEPSAESDAGPLAEEIPAQPLSVSDIMPDNFAQHAFANHFDMPQDFADALARPNPENDGPANDVPANDVPVSAIPSNDVPANEQDFLDSARRSAREAAEADGRGLLGWTRSADSEKKKRPLFLVILAAIFFLLLAAAAALMLNQRFSQAVTPPKPTHVATANKPAVTVVPHLQMAQPQIAALPAIPAAPNAAPPPRAAIAASADKVLAAANGGNDVAETIMGLRNLDAGDSVAAFQWLEKAALQGQPVAEYSLGTLYERGQGVTASPALALKWYLAAANQGNRKAMHNLAVAYAEGSAGPKNTQEAARWFAQAAALGLSDSQFNLAVLYERGDGVPQSLIDSYKWYSIAATGGDAESKARIAVLKTQLSVTDRQAAERAAQNFRPEALNRIANVPPEPGEIGG
jgi:localization factor PodJL